MVQPDNFGAFSYEEPGNNRLNPQILSILPLFQTIKQIQQRKSRRDLSRAVAQGQKNPLHYGLPHRLSSVRCALGLAAKHLSFAAGLSEGVVRSIEDEEQVPKLDTVERIACALGVPPCWLAFGEDGPREFKPRRDRSQDAGGPPEPVSGGLPYKALSGRAGERLRTKREALGFSLRGLATAAGVSFETIRKCEAGTGVPKLDTCERLAVALGVAPCWLAFGVGDSA
jgi:transcriptional regulator with XRE-family HTH domain